MLDGFPLMVHMDDTNKLEKLICMYKNCMIKTS